MGLFDRFNRLNQQAMQVFAFAQDEAIRLDHDHIGTEHLLLGLIREGEGVAARVLDAQGLELSKVRAAVTLTAGRGDSATTSKEITLSPRTKKVIEHAIDESRKLGHNHIGPSTCFCDSVREGEARNRRSRVNRRFACEVPHQLIAMLGNNAMPSASGPSAKELKGSEETGPFDRSTTVRSACSPWLRMSDPLQPQLHRAYRASASRLVREG